MGPPRIPPARSTAAAGVPASPAAPGAGDLCGPWLDRLLDVALEEDRGPGDLTTERAVPPGVRARARLVAKAAGVYAGGPLFRRVFERLAPDVTFGTAWAEGARFSAGDVLDELAGPARALLVGERTALNFLQRTCGVATLTRRFVDAAGGRARVLDTRKTTPGLRRLEKYAVRCGGGHNHRFGLYDQIMVKDNHVDGSGLGLRTLVERLRGEHGVDVVLTAEARDEAEGRAAIAGGADVVLLDNLAPEELARLVPLLRDAARSAGRAVELEASGGVELDTVAAYAATGVDRLSVGALTHSAPAVDLSLRLEILR